MKRSFGTVLKEAGQLLWQDFKNMKLAILMIAIYLWVVRTFLPVSCIWVAFTGFPCPGCGLTRAALLLLQGDVLGAFEIHPMIFPMIALLLAFVIRRYLFKRSTKVFVYYLIALMVMMIIYYIYRMATQFPGEPPMTYYYQNYIRIFLHIIGK